MSDKGSQWVDRERDARVLAGGWYEEILPGRASSDMATPNVLQSNRCREITSLCAYAAAEVTEGIATFELFLDAESASVSVTLGLGDTGACTTVGLPIAVPAGVAITLRASSSVDWIAMPVRGVIGWRECTHWEPGGPEICFNDLSDLDYFEISIT